MNGLHDLLEKLRKLEEAAAAPTQFIANYFHKNKNQQICIFNFQKNIL